MGINRFLVAKLLLRNAIDRRVRVSISTERQTYCLVGDTVNVASRVADLCKSYEADILVSHQTFQHLRQNYGLTALPSTHVKGPQSKLNGLQDLAGAGKIDDARVVSENLLSATGKDNKDLRYRDQMELIRFYLSLLGE
ncbi:MAG: hypothetical protein MUO68_15110 [Desulfobacteraceae bacterium]|jgi:class 3 adenylate cyclase|nr:hypothetical protein [Desulfobacteraceae bacterium]